MGGRKSAYRKVEGGAVVTDEILIKGSGHHVMLDNPWEDCARRILDWLEG